MTRKILLDTNVLISAFDTKNADAIDYLKSLLVDEEVALSISPLIRYEVLRGIAYDNNKLHEELKSKLNSFEEFDITLEVAELSSKLFRYAKSVDRNIVDKRSFDIFHLCTAKCNDLEFGSNDSDLEKLENLYQECLA
jgi:predicted nucleic acid-binding protein